MIQVANDKKVIGSVILDGGWILRRIVGTGFFALPVIGLQIVHQLEKFILSGLQLHGCLVRDTEQLYRVIIKAAFDVFVFYPFDLDLTVDAFKLLGTVEIRKMGRRNFEGKQL